MSVEYLTREIPTQITAVDVAGDLTMGDKLAAFESDLRGRIEKGARKVVVDLSRVTYMDSSGLGTLVVLAGRMDRSGGKLVISGAGGKVRQVIEMARVDRLLGMYGDVQAACAALNAQVVSA
jgi:anti-sigma B factor antagonist